MTFLDGRSISNKIAKSAQGFNFSWLGDCQKTYAEFIRHLTNEYGCAAWKIGQPLQDELLFGPLFRDCVAFGRQEEVFLCFPDNLLEVELVAVPNNALKSSSYSNFNFFWGLEYPNCALLGQRPPLDRQSVLESALYPLRGFVSAVSAVQPEDTAVLRYQHSGGGWIEAEIVAAFDWREVADRLEAAHFWELYSEYPPLPIFTGCQFTLKLEHSGIFRARVERGEHAEI